MPRVLAIIGAASKYTRNPPAIVPEKVERNKWYFVRCMVELDWICGQGRVSW
jgi:hypothetical protein